jgi:peptide/nickel transport system substrate-binding protein
MNTLSGPAYLQPLSQAYVESLGDDYGRNPIGVGPFKFKEWVAGEKIVLERNPDFDWGPAYTRGAAPFIEYIEYRIIPEYADQVAGLGAGEVDYMMLMPKDIESVRDSGQYHVFDLLQSGTGVVIVMKTSEPPFDDVRVRQALNYASDRQAIVKAVARGYAMPSYGPITPGTVGYWPGVEYLGYSYDLEQARALMAEAGYTLGEDGILEKVGEQLSLLVKTTPDQAKTSEILQAQYRVLGVQLQIEQLDLSALYAEIMSGNYDLTLTSHGWQDHMILFGLLHPSTLGGFNYAQVNDPQLTEMLNSLFVPSTPEKLQQIANDVQKYVVEQAFFVPLYAPTDYYALSKHVYDAVYNSFDGSLLLYDAYTELTVR